LKEHARPQDQVWVSGAAEVNRVRYYVSQAGLPNLWGKNFFKNTVTARASFSLSR
jgi:hypothetical protein